MGVIEVTDAESESSDHGVHHPDQEYDNEEDSDNNSEHSERSGHSDDEEEWDPYEEEEDEDDFEYYSDEMRKGEHPQVSAKISQ